MTLESISPAALPPSRGYSQVVVARGSRTVYVSGQVSADAEGNVVAPGDVVGQARRAFANMRMAIEAAGASVADIAKVSWFVVDYRSELLPELVAARREVMGDHSCASTLVGVTSLALPQYLVEVEAIAVVD